MEFLIEAQRWIQSAVSSELTGYAATHDLSALAAILPIGILFGSIHALTPGHSKTVLASYVLGSRLAYLRGVAVALTLSFVHVFSAVVIALTLTELVTRTLGGVGRAPLLEDLSRGLLLVIGAWLLFRAFRKHSHPAGEGLMVGIVAGLIPCPLTLFAMFLAISRGVPEAGFVFAASMMIGVAVTLSGVAALTIVARDSAIHLLERYGNTTNKVIRVFDAIAGLLLIIIGVAQLAR